VLHCRPELLVLEFKGTSRWQCCKPRRGCSCQPAVEARQHALARDGQRIAQGEEWSVALGSLMVAVCPLHADHGAQGAAFHRPLPWWPQLATCVMEALPHEPEPAARGSLNEPELSWGRGHGPLCLRSCGHKGCMALERAGAAQAKATMPPGNVICLRIAPSGPDGPGVCRRCPNADRGTADDSRETIISCRV
jgi:hypothetical protein